jgi:hypothetical protein
MDNELQIEIDDKILCFPSYPAECEYVRIIDKANNERFYWHFDEWGEDPRLVMGAIMGTLCTSLPDTVKDGVSSDDYEKQEFNTREAKE